MVFPRILTAVLLIPVVLVTIWYGSFPYFLFILGISILCYWEFSLMATQGGYPNHLILGLLGVVILLFSLFFDGVIPWGPVQAAPSPYMVLVMWIFVLFAWEIFTRDKGHSLLRIFTSISGLLLSAFLLGHLLLLRDVRMMVGEGFRPVGREITFFFFFLIWIVDSGAWLTGRLIGRTPLAPRLSPKKTWEGALGGTLMASLGAWFLREAFFVDLMGRGEAFFYGLIIAVLAQFSDLFESLIKRSLGVKNSSEILPGHGGILDRFDSFIFTTPIFYYLLLGTGRFH